MLSIVLISAVLPTTMLRPALAQERMPDAPSPRRDCVARYRGTVIDVCDPDAEPAGRNAFLLRSDASADGPIVGVVTAPADYARTTAWIARVATPGMLRVTGAELAARGAPTQFQNLCARWRGQILPLHHLDADGDGVIDSSEEVRLVAPGAGDRYNATDAYWFSDEPACHLSMPVQSASELVGPEFTVARQRGERRYTVAYWAQHAGTDKDHWFAVDRYVSSTLTSSDSWGFDATSIGDLPTISETAIYTIGGVVRFNRVHAVKLVGNGWNASFSWNGVGAFHAVFQQSTSRIPMMLEIPAGAYDQLLPDSVRWNRGVDLTLNGAAAGFYVERSGVHRLRGAAEDAVYDVSDPLSPTVITLDAARFTAEAGHAYFVFGSGENVTTAMLEAYSPSADLTAAYNVDAVYVAPQAWLAALEPLLVHRRANGVSAVSVPAEMIYAQFGHGQISPSAIREYLRYAYSSWTTRPRGVVLVGDATYDMRDYKGWGFPMILPPYMADIDPFNADTANYGETTCETCFAQLDFQNPLDDALPDLIFGRLPASTLEQLENYAGKLIGYETSTTDDHAGTWRSRVAYVADDAIRIDGSVDPAGNFWRIAEDSIDQQNFYVAVRRWYYDPSGALGNVSYAARAPSGTSNPPYEGTRAIFEEGAVLINYIGHSSWNRIGDLGRPDLYNNLMLHQDDADTLANGGRLPVMLMMTCFTGAYTYAYSDPAYGTHLNTAFEERMVMAQNGAIASWGSTGLGVAHGHDVLLHGFYSTLWGNGGTAKVLGDLAHGGYAALFDASQVDHRTALIHMYMITGDPFMRPRVYAPRVLAPEDVRRLFAPVIVR